MKRTKIRGLSALMLVVACSQSFGLMWVISDPIDASQEVPTNPSHGNGLAFGTYDDITNDLDISVAAVDLEAAAVAAHIHGPAAPGVNGPVIFSLGVGSQPPFDYFTVNSFTLTAAQEIDFLAGLNYVNIHTTFRPGGEIRGQLRPYAVPEPASLAVLGLGAFALLRKRRK